MKKLLSILLLTTWIVSGQVSFAPTTISGNQFGRSLAADGNRFLVSSASTTTAAGKCYLFDRNPNTGVIANAATFTQTDGLVTDNYGQSVSVAGNIVAIGAEMHNGTGAVYTYRRVNNSWSFLNKIIPTDANLGDRFGTVKLLGNQLLVGSPESEAQGLQGDVNSGSILVYTLSGSQWILSQELAVPGAIQFGSQIEAENGQMVTAALTNDGQRVFYGYSLVGNQWVENGSSQPYGSDDTSISQFTLDDGRIYFVQRQFPGAHTIYSLDLDDWNETAELSFSSFDQQYDRIAVSGGRMLIGSGSYTLQLQRKFPVLCYQKADSWQYHSSIYGNGPESFDDYFGMTMAKSGDNLIVGAPAEGLALSVGNAYYIDLSLLNRAEFVQDNLVLYPNPASEFISFDSDEQFASVRIFSATGALALSLDNPSSTVDVSSLSGGIYVANFTTASGVDVVRKFVKR